MAKLSICSHLNCGFCKSSPRQRGVLDDHLDAVAALPIVAAEVAGDVEALTACRGEKAAQFVFGGAEGDGLDPGAIGAFQTET